MRARSSNRRTLDYDRRGVTPAVSKSLEATVVVLFVGALTATLYGGVVPDYRTAAGDEVADRTLAGASHRVQAAVPPEAGTVEARARVDLPATIRDRDYRIRADGRELVLDHPHPGVGDRARLALPDHVVSVTGEWYSRGEAWVVVEDAPGGVTVRLERSRPSLRREPGIAARGRPDGGDRR